MGSADVDSRLEEQLIDGILYAFQEQTTEDATMLGGFGAVVNSLGKRVKVCLDSRVYSKQLVDNLFNFLAILTTNLWYCFMATQQQGCQSPATSCGSHLKGCKCYEIMPGRKAHGSLGPSSV